MIRRHRVASVLVLGLVVGLAIAASAGDVTMKHSGSLFAIDEMSGALTGIVLDEVGPWRVHDGETVVTRREIVVTGRTVWARVARAAEAPSGFPGDFVEAALDASAVAPGDVVTIDCLHRGGKLIATKVTVIDVAAP